jgi:hypothetical protein
LHAEEANNKSDALDAEMADFLAWLYGNREETGDLVLRESIKLHRLVLKWKRIEDLESYENIDQGCLNILIRWLYTNQLDNHTEIDLCNLYKVAHDLNCSELGKCVIEKLELLLSNDSSKTSFVLNYSDHHNLSNLAELCVCFLGAEGSLQNLSEILCECTPKRAVDIILRRFGHDGSINVWPALREACLSISDDNAFKSLSIALETISGEPALCVACYFGDSDVVSRLIRLGWKADSVFADSTTPLHAAVSNSEISDNERCKCVQVLIKNGAACRPGMDQSPLHIASKASLLLLASSACKQTNYECNNSLQLLHDVELSNSRLYK